MDAWVSLFDARTLIFLYEDDSKNIRRLHSGRSLVSGMCAKHAKNAKNADWSHSSHVKIGGDKQDKVIKAESWLLLRTVMIKNNLFYCASNLTKHNK